MKDHTYTLEEIENIISSDTSFAKYAHGRDSVQGQTLALLRSVMTVGWETDGDNFSDEAMLTMVQDILAAHMHYESTHDWED